MHDTDNTVEVVCRKASKKENQEPEPEKRKKNMMMMKMKGAKGKEHVGGCSTRARCT